MENKKVNRIVGIIAYVLALVFALGLIVCNIITEKTKKISEEIGFAVSDETEERGIALASAVIASDDYTEYGISPQAENAVQLTATITPSNADDKTVDWAVRWKSSSYYDSQIDSDTVTDFVTVTPTSDGALTANVACLRPFGAQIEVVVTSRANTSATASCTCDYLGRFASVRLNLQHGSTTTDTITLSNTETYTFDYTPGGISTGSVYPSVAVTSVKFEVTDEFKAATKTGNSPNSAPNQTWTMTISDNAFTLTSDTLLKGINTAYNLGGTQSMAGYNGLLNGINNCTGTHAVITATYAVVYNGTTLSTDTATLNVKFSL